ncbi:MAG: pentapeptide repeat-containing protein [Candidatus Omnitrophica bacterium]|nr:pentapeptide repeat-containing protein [Candidatus Omnitrophota bacterium]
MGLVRGFLKTFVFRLVAGWIILTLALPPQVCAQGLNLPQPGVMVSVTPAFAPVMIKGLQVHPENPLLFDFIMDTGESGLKVDSPDFKAACEKLVKYFLASLTVKEQDLWVNLSPYEKDRMIPQDLGQTELGRDMLAQDYILKQLTASLIYPEKDLGKQFWTKVYAEAQEKFGTTDVPVDTFNKVWIVPDKAKVIEKNNAGYVVSAHLKVMLESDYVAANQRAERVGGGVPDPVNPALAQEKSQSHKVTKSPGSYPERSEGSQQEEIPHPEGAQNDNGSQELAKSILREVIVPAIETEVNQGQNFAQLRQMFYAMILSTWYKIVLKDAFLNRVYANKGKTAGVQSDDPAVNEKIYQQYLEAYKKGVFNYIKEESQPSAVSGQPEMVPRKYFSGGNDFAGLTTLLQHGPAARDENPAAEGDMAEVSVRVQPSDASQESVNAPKMIFGKPEGVGPNIPGAHPVNITQWLLGVESEEEQFKLYPVTVRPAGAAIVLARSFQGSFTPLVSVTNLSKEAVTGLMVVLRQEETWHGFSEALREFQGVRPIDWTDKGVLTRVGNVIWKEAYHFAARYPLVVATNSAVPENPSVVRLPGGDRTRIMKRFDFGDGRSVRTGGTAQIFPRSAQPGAEVSLPGTGILQDARPVANAYEQKVVIGHGTFLERDIWDLLVLLRRQTARREVVLDGNGQRHLVLLAHPQSPELEKIREKLQADTGLAIIEGEVEKKGNCLLVASAGQPDVIVSWIDASVRLAIASLPTMMLVREFMEWLPGWRVSHPPGTLMWSMHGLTQDALRDRFGLNMAGAEAFIKDWLALSKSLAGEALETRFREMERALSIGLDGVTVTGASAKTVFSITLNDDAQAVGKQDSRRSSFNQDFALGKIRPEGRHSQHTANVGVNPTPSAWPEANFAFPSFSGYRREKMRNTKFGFKNYVFLATLLFSGVALSWDLWTESHMPSPIRIKLDFFDMRSISFDEFRMKKNMQSLWSALKQGQYEDAVGLAKKIIIIAYKSDIGDAVKKSILTHIVLLLGIYSVNAALMLLRWAKDKGYIKDSGSKSPGDHEEGTSPYQALVARIKTLRKSNYSWGEGGSAAVVQALGRLGFNGSGDFKVPGEDVAQADYLLDNDLMKQALGQRGQFETDRQWVEKFLAMRESDPLARSIFEAVDGMDEKLRADEALKVIRTPPNKENNYYGLGMEGASNSDWTFERWLRQSVPGEGFSQLVVRDINYCFPGAGGYRSAFPNEQSLRNNIRSIYIVLRAIDDLARAEAGKTSPAVETRTSDKAVAVTPEAIKRELEEKARQILASPLVKNIVARRDFFYSRGIVSFLQLDHPWKQEIFWSIYEKTRNWSTAEVLQELGRIQGLPWQKSGFDFYDVKSMRELFLRPTQGQTDWVQAFLPYFISLDIEFQLDRRAVKVNTMYWILLALERLGRGDVLLFEPSDAAPGSSYYRYVASQAVEAWKGQPDEVLSEIVARYAKDLLSFTDVLLEMLLDFDPQTNRDKITSQTLQEAFARPGKEKVKESIVNYIRLVRSLEAHSLPWRKALDTPDVTRRSYVKQYYDNLELLKAAAEAVMVGKNLLLPEAENAPMAEEALTRLESWDVEMDGEEARAIGRVVDQIGADEHSRVLHVGAGLHAIFDVAFAVRKARVNVVQPFFSEDRVPGAGPMTPPEMIPQSNYWSSNFADLKGALQEDFGKDLVGDRVSIEDNWFENTGSSGRYSHVLLLRVYEVIGRDESQQRRDFTRKLLDSLDDKATILMQVYATDTARQIQILKTLGAEFGYSIEDGRKYDLGSRMPGALRELKVTRRSPLSSRMTQGDSSAEQATGDDSAQTADPLQDPKVRADIKVLREALSTAYGGVARSPQFEFVGSVDSGRLEVRQDVFRFTVSGLQVIRKEMFKKNNLNVIVELAGLGRRSIVPIFTAFNDHDHYYELDLRPFNYRTLLEILTQNKEWLTGERRRKIMAAVDEGLRFRDREWFDQGNLLPGNILIRLDRNGDITDVKIIDFKFLKKVEFAKYSFLQEIKNGGPFNLWGRDVDDVTFEWMDLSGAKFRNAHLSQSRFTGSILRDADFEGARVGPKAFELADLTDANLEHVTDAVLDEIEQSFPAHVRAGLERAMGDPAQKGGIDFNAKKLDLGMSQEGVKVPDPIDPAMLAGFERSDFAGVVPVILRITPLASPMAALDAAPSSALK